MLGTSLILGWYLALKLAADEGLPREKIASCYMTMRYPEWIWHNGSIKPWAEATTHATRTLRKIVLLDD